MDKNIIKKIFREQIATYINGTNTVEIDNEDYYIKVSDHTNEKLQSIIIIIYDNSSKVDQLKLSKALYDSIHAITIDTKIKHNIGIKQYIPRNGMQNDIIAQNISKIIEKLFSLHDEDFKY